MRSTYYILATLLAIGSTFATLPSDIEKCMHGETDCIAKVTTNIIQNNPNGKKDLGLPKLDPFRINNLVISGENTASVNLKLSFKDVDITGLSKGTIDRVVGFEKDPATSKFEMSGLFPLLKLKGKYIADGRILILPIQGNGDADLTLENVRISGKYKPEVKMENGQVKLVIKKIKTLVEPELLKIRLDNLFNGDGALGTNMNTFLNENWKEVWTELSPGINEAIGEVIFSILTETFLTLNYNEIFKQ